VSYPTKCLGAQAYDVRSMRRLDKAGATALARQCGAGHCNGEDSMTDPESAQAAVQDLYGRLLEAWNQQGCRGLCRAVHR
jgi:hypothetical protein